VDSEAAGGPVWYRACEAPGCAEVATRGDDVMLRSSLSPEVVLVLARAEWREFLAGAKGGLFDDMPATADGATAPRS
jgi:hypothetical protein